MTDQDEAGRAPRPPITSGMSRRAFLSMSWRRESFPNNVDPAETAPPPTLTILGEIETIRLMAPASVIASADRSDIYGIRTNGGLIAVRTRCPNDDAPVAWRPDDPSEDDLDERGRFYCPRDASIFDRLGSLIAGPATESLPTLVIREIEGTLMADLASPDPPGGASQLVREFPLPAS